MNKIIVFIVFLLLGTNAVLQEQVDFEVDLPDSWKLVSFSEEGRLWTYESKNGKHRLTVSILYYSAEPSHADQNRFLKEFINVRQEQSAKIATEISFTPIETRDYESAWVMKYNESSAEKRVATTKAISTRIGIANFYFESFSSDELHESISHEILASTGFVS